MSGLEMKVGGSLMPVRSIIYFDVIVFDAQWRLAAVILSRIEGGLEDHQARRFTDSHIQKQEMPSRNIE